ncbi:uncharacterized protein LOC101887585 isoform X2 [Musca domestica]|nr:uncharacterized protein LOC101887585 isoform X2 [Musca domestica]
MDIIWINSQKYLILNGNGLCVKTYPEIISSRYEQEILQELLYNIEKIHSSNCRMSKSLEYINEQLIDLKNWCSKLDYKVDSPFILGTYYLKSLSYTRNLIEDLYQYFHTNLSKLKSWAELITPSDPVSIEDYKALIQPCKDYETNVVEYLDSCRCMRSKRFKCREKQT